MHTLLCVYLHCIKRLFPDHKFIIGERAAASPPPLPVTVSVLLCIIFYLLDSKYIHTYIQNIPIHLNLTLTMWPKHVSVSIPMYVYMNFWEHQQAPAASYLDSHIHISHTFNYHFLYFLTPSGLSNNCGVSRVWKLACVRVVNTGLPIYEPHFKIFASCFCLFIALKRTSPRPSLICPMPSYNHQTK